MISNTHSGPHKACIFAYQKEYDPNPMYYGTLTECRTTEQVVQFFPQSLSQYSSRMWLSESSIMAFSWILVEFLILIDSILVFQGVLEDV